MGGRWGGDGGAMGGRWGGDGGGDGGAMGGGEAESSFGAPV